MKILYITGSLPPLNCGVGFYSEKLLPKLAGKIEVNVLTTSGYSDSSGLPTSHVDNWKIGSLFKIYGYCKKSDANCFVIQYPARGYKKNIGINLLPFVLRYIMRRPVVITLHEYHGSGLLGRTRNVITAIAANKIFISNNYDLTSLPRILKNKAVIIPIGSNVAVTKIPSTLYDKIIKDSNFSKLKRVGVFFGFPNPNKGIDLLLDSVEKSESQLIFMAGIEKDNPYHVLIEKKINVMRSRGVKIFAAGYLSDSEVSSILSRADYFIMPQPLPLTAKSGTAIAAAVHGLPIISTGADDKNINYPYVDGENSILLNPMNSDSLTKLMNEINNNKVDLESISKNMGSLSSYFDWQKIASKYIDEINKVIS